MLKWWSSVARGDIQKHKISNDKWVWGDELLRVAPQCESTDRLQGLHRVGEVAHEGESIQSLLQTRDPPKIQDKFVLVCQFLHWAAVLLVVHQQLQLVVRWYEVRQQLQEVDGQGCLVVPEWGKVESVSTHTGQDGGGGSSTRYLRLYGGADAGRAHPPLA